MRIVVRGRGVSVRNLRVLRDVYSPESGATDFLATDAGRDLMGDVRQFPRSATPAAHPRVRRPGRRLLRARRQQPAEPRRPRLEAAPFVPARLVLGRVLTGLRP